MMDDIAETTLDAEVIRGSHPFQELTKYPVPTDTPIKKQVPLDRYKLLQVLHAMVDAVLVFNQQGKVQLCNPAFTHIFHLDADAIQGKPLQQVFGEVAPELPDIILQFIQSGEAFSQEVTLYPGRQKRVFLLYTLPVEENGKVTDGVAVFHDVSKVKQTDKIRRDFVANVSHELRTPLSAIHGYAETLLEGALKDEAVAKDFIQIIFNHSQRLSQLVRDLLDLSKLESEECPFDLAPANVVPIIEKVMGLSGKLLNEKNISLAFEPPQTLPQVVVNESYIEQVVTNLLENAIKYTPEGGNIQIRIQQNAKQVQINITDTGIGIESKHIPRLFERFYRVDKARSRDLGGTGLGLSIVKHIIQYHGGEVWVNSVPGQGSTFSFTLQIAENL